MRQFVGKRIDGQAVVQVFTDGVLTGLLPEKTDLREHSISGLSWGRASAGARQLALALAVEVLRDDRKALQVYERLFEHAVSRWDTAGFTWDELVVRGVLLGFLEDDGDDLTEAVEKCDPPGDGVEIGRIGEQLRQSEAVVPEVVPSAARKGRRRPGQVETPAKPASSDLQSEIPMAQAVEETDRIGPGDRRPPLEEKFWGLFRRSWNDRGEGCCDGQSLG